jgi:nitrogen-specific signal transduction histidine kinase
VGIDDYDGTSEGYIDGAERWVAKSGCAVEGCDGRVVRTVGPISDITDRKQSEQALALADRGKDECVAMLAHELRNPLAPICSSVRVLSTRQTDDTIAAHCCALLRCHRETST